MTRGNLNGSEQKKLRRLRKRAARRQKNACFWCGTAMIEPNRSNSNQDDPRLCTADHHPVPRHLGGRTVEGNIVAACKRCNSGRHHDAPLTTGVNYTAGDDSPAPSRLHDSLIDWKDHHAPMAKVTP